MNIIFKENFYPLIKKETMGYVSNNPRTYCSATYNCGVNLIAR
jgi:hypothetical protein